MAAEVLCVHVCPDPECIYRRQQNPSSRRHLRVKDRQSPFDQLSGENALWRNPLKARRIAANIAKLPDLFCSMLMLDCRSLLASGTA